MQQFKIIFFKLRNLGFLLSLHWILVGSTAQAQGIKPAVTKADYPLWGTLYSDRISDRGDWVSYLMDYDNSPDTLFVSNTSGKNTYKLPSGGSGVFCGEEVFAFTDDKGALILLNLISGKKTVIGKVSAYDFAAKGKYLITLSANTLEIRDNNGAVVREFTDVGSYKSGKDDTMLLCSQNIDGKNRGILIDLLKGMKVMTIMEAAEGKISSLTWQRNGKSLAFLKENSRDNHNDVYYYSISENRLRRLDASSCIFPEGFHIESGNITRLSISENGNRLLFVMKRTDKVMHNPDKVQQWNTNDAILVTERRYNNETEQNIRLAAWTPETGRVVMLTTDDTPLGLVTPDYRYALTYSPEESQPQYVLNPTVSYHLKKTATGEQIGTLPDMPTDISSALFSCEGKYFAYFKDNDWVAYDFEEVKLINLTTNSGLNLINSEDESWKGNYSIAAWGPGDTYALAYDAYDIWKLSLDGESPKRLTYGREKNICYRIVPPSFATQRPNFTGHTVPSIDLKKNILLSVSCKDETGYSLFKPNGTIISIVRQNALVSGIIKADDAEVYTYESQNYDKPPSLNTFKTGKIGVLFQSNRQHYDFSWGKQEIINYRNSENKELQGLLYYPANYDPAKKYPMVVNIYEKQLYMEHYYYIPSEFNMAGFNAANLTAQGYFVLLPDIEYKLGNPAISAFDCVTAATKKIISLGLLFPDKIALMGTSYGGYETNFIMTQTNLFCTAVTGASVFDLQSWYLSMGDSTHKAEIWRYESQQWRMGKSLFEDRIGYKDNSPAAFVENITAPMLIWAGENDRNIDYCQSVALYLALRRLNKKGIMLLYPKEGHSLVMPANQADLTQKVGDWLAYYLKGEPAPEWIIQGIK